MTDVSRQPEPSGARQPEPSGARQPEPSGAHQPEPSGARQPMQPSTAYLAIPFLGESLFVHHFAGAVLVCLGIFLVVRE